MKIRYRPYLSSFFVYETILRRQELLQCNILMNNRRGGVSPPVKEVTKWQKKKTSAIIATLVNITYTTRIGRNTSAPCASMRTKWRVISIPNRKNVYIINSMMNTKRCRSRIDGDMFASKRDIFARSRECDITALWRLRYKKNPVFKKQGSFCCTPKGIHYSATKM